MDNEELKNKLRNLLDIKKAFGWNSDQQFEYETLHLELLCRILDK